MTILPKTRYSLGKLGLFRYKVLIDKILVKYCPMFGSQISHIQIYHTPSDNSTCPFSSYIHNNQLICNSYHSNRFHLVSCTQQARQSLFRSFYLLFLPFFLFLKIKVQLVFQLMMPNTYLKGIPVTGKFDVCPTFAMFMCLTLPQGGVCTCIVYIRITMVTTHAHTHHLVAKLVP